jgi:site-specific recombinase XerD
MSNNSQPLQVRNIPIITSESNSVVQNHKEDSLDIVRNPIHEPEIVDIIAQGRSESTREIYEDNFRLFQLWSIEQDLPYLPASKQSIELYILYLRDKKHKISTIELRISAIKAIHKAFVRPFPEIPHFSEIMRGLRRDIGCKQRQARPMTMALLSRGLSKENTVMAHRDRTLLLIGFAGAFRRSELVDLCVKDIEFREEGMIITITKSKTDQTGIGRQVPIHYSCSDFLCPVKNVKQWLQKTCIKEGTLFRNVNKGDNIGTTLTARSVNRIVKKCITNAGEDPSLYSGHSLRSGYATEAARRGAHSHQIMMVTGHKSDAMVRRYVREGRAFLDTVAVL